MPRIFAVAIALFLTGCVTYIGNGGMADSVGSHLNYVTKSGRLAVMVLGDPVPGKRAEIEAMVISALDNNFATLKTTFVATKLIVPAPDKILFVFNPEITALASEMCHAPAAAKAGNQGAKMRIGVIFCSGRARSQIWASLDRISSVDDLLLAEVIDGLAFRLIPNGQRTAY